MNIYGRNPVIEAIKEDNEISCLYLSNNSDEGSIRKIYAMAKEKNILMKRVTNAKLNKLADSKNHQGVVAVIEEYDYYDFNELLRDVREKNKKNKSSLILILDGIQDPHNLGAIIRSAVGFDIDAIVIQNRRACQVTPTVIKTSAGNADKIKISRVTNITTAINSLKDEKMWVYSLDMEGQNIKDVDLTENVALVIGNEGKGVSQKVLTNTDFLIKIPINHKLESLNASVAASCAMYEISRQKGS